MENTNLCRDAPSEEGFTASVHLDYREIPVSEPAWAFTQVKITNAATGSYFATSGQAFGYGGFQVHDDNPLYYTGRVIFSIWDQGCDRDVETCQDEELAVVKACGTNVICRDFGNEGTGQQSFSESNTFPVVNETYSMVTHAVPVGNNRVQYSGFYFIDKTWKFLATMEINHGSLPWWHTQFYNFVEQYAATQGFAKRAADFGPFYVSESNPIDFQQVQTTHFDRNTDHNHKRVNAYVTSDNTVALEIGGDAIQDIMVGERLEVATEFSKPDALEILETLIPCIEVANLTTTAIEACLDPNLPPLEPTAAPVDTAPTEVPRTNEPTVSMTLSPSQVPQESSPTTQAPNVLNRSRAQPHQLRSLPVIALALLLFTI